MADLIWRDEQDDNDLTEWSAASIYHDYGDAFMFRIKEQPIGTGFTVRYIETSDAELMLQAPRTWESLQAAKDALQAAKDALQADHLAMIAGESALDS